MKFKLEGKYVQAGITAFLVIALSIVLFFALYRAQGLADVVKAIVNTLTPFIYGLVMAYLLCPIYNWCFNGLNKTKAIHTGKKDHGVFLSKFAATLVSILFMFAIITGLLWMVIPGLIESISSIIKMLPDKITDFSNWIDETIRNMPEMAGSLEGFINNTADKLEEWLQNTILPGSETIITNISNGVFGVVIGVKNFIIGVVICIFFLNSKDAFTGQSRKFIFSIMNKKNAYKFLYGCRYTNETFGKYINGKLIDSLIVGIICFVFMSIFQWPYAMLISVIVGVTNIIPFFGPVIGAIPSALLIFMVSPIKMVYFLIFILILQQLDGNVIGPKILGGSIGLPSFWVMFAILVGGGLFGFVGMVIGIPVFACIYAFVAYAVNKRLEKKGLTTNSSLYKDLDARYNEEIKHIEVKTSEGEFNEKTCR